MEQTKFTNLEVEIITDRPEECIVECSCQFYEDDMISFFNLDFENLYDLNLKSIKMVCNWLKIKMPEGIYNKKNKYDYKIQDLTNMSNCKRTSYFKQKKYNQTFEANNGFINDLSVIDLIFNCGSNSIDYF